MIDDEKIDLINKGVLIGKDHSKPSPDTLKFMQDTGIKIDKLSEKLDKHITKQRESEEKNTQFQNLVTAQYDSLVCKIDSNSEKTEANHKIVEGIADAVKFVQQTNSVLKYVSRFVFYIGIIFACIMGIKEWFKR